MKMTRAVHDTVVLTTSPKCIRSENALVIGNILQNQDAAANIFLRSGGDGTARSYLKLMPLGDMLQDILPPQDELWAYSDVSGTILTIIEKYET